MDEAPELVPPAKTEDGSSGIEFTLMRRPSQAGLRDGEAEAASVALEDAEAAVVLVAAADAAAIVASCSACRCAFIACSSAA